MALGSRFRSLLGNTLGGGVYFKDTLQVRTNVFFVEGAERIEPPDDLYVTDTFTTKAMEFIEEAVTRTQKPFFLYQAHIAPHWPLQAKPEDIEKYKGKYDAGWDVVRERRFERQKEMGLLPPDATLSPRHPQARPWSEMPEEAKKDLAHRMAVYAAQIDCIDQNIGRLVKKLKELNQFDNTLILFLSDNGCSAEGGPGGFSRGQPGAAIGTGLSYASVGLEWANASDTPFRKFKMDTHEGGIATPLIAHWPAGIGKRIGRKKSGGPAGARTGSRHRSDAHSARCGERRISENLRRQTASPAGRPKLEAATHDGILCDFSRTPALLGASGEQGRAVGGLEGRLGEWETLGTLQPGRGPHRNAKSCGKPTGENPRTDRALASLGGPRGGLGMGQTPGTPPQSGKRRS
jgi:hypothetical protein